MGPWEVEDPAAERDDGDSTSHSGINDRVLAAGNNLRVGGTQGSRVEGDIDAILKPNGPVLATDDNVTVQVGGERFANSRVQGAITDYTAVNRAAGQGIDVQVGGVRIEDSRVRGDIDSYTQLNGAVLASGQGIDVQVGGVRIADSRVRGDIDSYTEVNGVVLSAGSNCQLQVGGVTIR